MKKWIGLLSVAALCCILMHAAAAQGILEAGERCVTVIIPSLYLFTILSVLLTDAGLLTMLRGKALPAALLLFSQIGGYPVGAQLVCGLGQKLSDKARRRMLCVCFGCGPAFLMGTVCRGLPVRAAVVLLVSVILPNLLLGMFLLRHIELPAVRQPEKKKTVSECFVAAVEKGAAAMLKICSMILVFGALTAMLREAGLLPFLAEFLSAMSGMGTDSADALLGAVLDVSAVTEYLARGGSLPVAAALLSFGGICVHLQLAALCGGKMPWLSFWLCRIAAAAGSFACSCAGLHIFCSGAMPAALLQQARFQAQNSQGSTAAVCCLIIMSVLLLLRAHRLTVRTSMKKYAE